MMKRYASVTKGMGPARRHIPSWTLVVACNNETVLRSTLLASPTIDGDCQVIIERDSSCAARAYNRGLDRANADLVVFAHQDVFLPKGWIENIRHSIDQIEQLGSAWAVLGVFGVPSEPGSAPCGFCYSTGLRKTLGSPFGSPIAAHTLDELVLIVRRSSGIRFDSQLPGFHLYGADFCLQASAAGFKNFIVSAFCVHNSNGIVRMPASFWKAYFYLRKKWQNQLPVTTCCTRITRVAWPVIRRVLTEWKEVILHRQVGKRLDQIPRFYDEFLRNHPEIVTPTQSSSTRLKIGLLGATFETPNLGVSALAAGAIQCMLSAYPDANIFLLDYARESSVRAVRAGAGSIEIPLVNMRFSKAFWLSNNIAMLLLSAVALRYLRAPVIRQWIVRGNHCLREITSADLFGAVAGGDSFSDLYGRARFLYVALPQIVVLLLNKRLVLLPQTYGPFRYSWTRFVAKWIVSHAERAWSRDHGSLVELMRGGERSTEPSQEFCYDMGFGIDSHTPRRFEVEGVCLDSIEKKNLIGVNVSGLLFQNGYSGKNEFKIRSDYKELVHSVVELLLSFKDARVLLVPHVYGEGDGSESDAVACERIFADFKTEYPGRIAVLRGEYSPTEVRYLIGRCGFFVGSRMHACIAAVSQCIPAVSIAYSDKFVGVMRPAGADALVADARTCGTAEMLKIIQQAFERRAELARELDSRMPDIRETVLNLMRSVPRYSKTFDPFSIAS